MTGSWTKFSRKFRSCFSIIMFMVDKMQWKRINWIIKAFCTLTCHETTRLAFTCIHAAQYGHNNCNNLVIHCSLQSDQLRQEKSLYRKIELKLFQKENWIELRQNIRFTWNLMRCWGLLRLKNNWKFTWLYREQLLALIRRILMMWDTVTTWASVKHVKLNNEICGRRNNWWR